jgi:hypothetical protein
MLAYGWMEIAGGDDYLYQFPGFDGVAVLKRPIESIHNGRRLQISIDHKESRTYSFLLRGNPPSSGSNDSHFR